MDELITYSNKFHDEEFGTFLVTFYITFFFFLKKYELGIIFDEISTCLTTKNNNFNKNQLIKGSGTH